MKTRTVSESKYMNLMWAYLESQELLKDPARSEAGLREHIIFLEEELDLIRKNYVWVCDRLKELE